MLKETKLNRKNKLQIKTKQIQTKIAGNSIN